VIFIEERNMPKQTIGFIGLGTMGSRMSKKLLNAGHWLVGYDVEPSCLEDFTKNGGISAGSPAEVARKSEIIITMLPSSPHVEKVSLGVEGIIEGINPGSIYIDMSTIDPITTRRVGSELAIKKVEMLDCPVSRGVDAAEKGTLSIYVGGKEDVFKKVLPVLKQMGTDIDFMGPLGSGAVAKLTNNLIAAGIVAITTEAFVFGAKAGVDPDRLFNAVAGGSGDSFPLHKHIKKYSLTRNFEEKIFPVDFIMKDIDLGLATAKSLDLPMPVAGHIREIYAMSKARGYGKGYYPDVIRFFEDFAGIEVKSKEAGKRKGKKDD